MIFLGVNILPDGIELIYDANNGRCPDYSIKFVHADKLSAHAPHVAAWLPVFEVVQGMIVRGCETAMEGEGCE